MGRFDRYGNGVVWARGALGVLVGRVYGRRGRIGRMCVGGEGGKGRGGRSAFLIPFTQRVARGSEMERESFYMIATSPASHKERA